MHQGYIHLASLSALSLPTQHPLQYTQSESLLPLCSHRPLLSLNHYVYLTVIHSINSLIQTIPDEILLLPDTVLGHFVVVNQGWHITIIIFCEELNKTFLKLEFILSSLWLLLPRTCSIKHWLSCHFLLSQLSTARKMCSESVCLYNSLWRHRCPFGGSCPYFRHRAVTHSFTKYRLSMSSVSGAMVCTGGSGLNRRGTGYIF